MKKIGLVGGISWPSTIDYYTFINQEVNKRLGGLQFAECIIYSLNFGDLQEKTWENSFDLLLSACNNLKKTGVEAIALCANTAHLYADQLQKDIDLPIIHIGVATAEAVKKSGLKKLALLGTKFTMELDFYRKKLEEYGLEIITPATQEIRDYVQQTVKEELGRGIIKEDTKQNYINIVKALIKSGAQGVILGCTEIPLLINQEDFCIPVFDTTKIHSQAIVDFIVS
jgi:aspartate racemase